MAFGSTPGTPEVGEGNVCNVVKMVGGSSDIEDILFIGSPKSPG